MDALAIVLQQPERIALSRLDIGSAGDQDVVVDIDWSGISTGTERLLWSGRMPHFPGMGYPLVPGYESVGRVAQAGAASGRAVGETVFVPGSRCFGEVRGLFGGAASRVVSPGARVVPVPARLGERATLLALAATAYRARAGLLAGAGELIVGHGVLGRLVARLSVLGGGDPVVWETNPRRAAGARGYRVVHPDVDTATYRTIIDVSGDSAILDVAIARLAPQGEVVLAGFYDKPLSFAFPPAFMKEARIRVSAEWRAGDMEAVTALIANDRLALDELITHRSAASDAESAYRTAFDDPSCLKMILDWRNCA